MLLWVISSLRGSAWSSFNWRVDIWSQAPLYADVSLGGRHEENHTYIFRHLNSQLSNAAYPAETQEGAISAQQVSDNTRSVKVGAAHGARDTVTPAPEGPQYWIIAEFRGQ